MSGAGDARRLKKSVADLILAALQCSALDWDAWAKPEEVVAECKEFIELPCVQTHPAWRRQIRKCFPPRQTLARLARRFHPVSLHITMEPWGWGSDERGRTDFLAEVDRVVEWYRSPVKQFRFKKGMKRDDDNRVQNENAQPVFTATAVRILRQPRDAVTYEGLRAWARTAAALRETGIEPVTATVPVEAMWDFLETKGFAPHTTYVTTRTWNINKKLLMLKYNYRRARLMGFAIGAHGDAEIQETLDNMSIILQIIRGQKGLVSMERRWEEFLAQKRGARRGRPSTSGAEVVEETGESG